MQGWGSVLGARWGVARLDGDGALDPAFADDGLKVIDWTVTSRALRIEQDASGAIYVAGDIENSRSWDIAVARLFENGEIDGSFSFTGEGPGAVLDNGGEEVGLSLVWISETTALHIATFAVLGAGWGSAASGADFVPATSGGG